MGPATIRRIGTAALAGLVAALLAFVVKQNVAIAVGIGIGGLTSLAIQAWQDKRPPTLQQMIWQVVGYATAIYVVLLFRRLI